MSYKKKHLNLLRIIWDTWDLETIPITKYYLEVIRFCDQILTIYLEKKTLTDIFFAICLNKKGSCNPILLLTHSSWYFKVFPNFSNETITLKFFWMLRTKVEHILSNLLYIKTRVSKHLTPTATFSHLFGKTLLKLVSVNVKPNLERMKGIRRSQF